MLFKGRQHTSFSFLNRKFGFGKNSTLFFFKSGINPSTSFENLTKKQKTLVIGCREKTELKIKKKNSLSKYRAFKSYKGLKLKLKLPLNGGRTKSNAKTRKKFNIF